MKKYVIQLTVTLLVVYISFQALMLSSVRPLLGLDLQGGFSVILEPKIKVKSDLLDTSVDIIRNRVDSLGVAEPEISRQGNTIVVDLPGIKDRSKAEQVIGQTAELRFREVMYQYPILTKAQKKAAAEKAKKEAAKKASSTTTSTTVVATKPGKSKSYVGADTSTTQPVVTQTSTVDATQSTAADQNSKQITCSGQPAQLTQDLLQDKVTTNNLPQNPVVLDDKDKKTRYILCPAVMSGKVVKSAKASLTQEGKYSVQLVLTTEGVAEFQQKVATTLVGKPLAIELDGIVQSAPTINKGITGEQLEISGNFTQKEVEDLATVLKFGSLPIPLQQQAARSISPTLGKDQLHAGLIAGLIGIILVMIYMLIYYRVLALVVLLGLSLTGLSIFTIVSLLSDRVGLTLSLAGAVGLIVSLGVTVDSYIVYFEKIKDIANTNNNVKLSAERAYSPALKTILAADFVSLLGAIVLYILATGNVRGFAFFLGLSTVLDLIISILFMHPLIMIITSSKKLVNAKVIGIKSGLDLTHLSKEGVN